jgi:cytochrome c biogenesis protein ResB
MSSSRLGRWLWRQYAFIASGRLTVWLLAILVLVLGVYLFIPQQGEASARALERWVEQKGLVGQLCRALGLTDVLRSAFFSGACGLMFINLLLCMIRRVRSTLGLFRFPERAPLASHDWLRREITAAALGEERIAELLRERACECND